jgi:hypothetical protein
MNDSDDDAAAEFVNPGLRHRKRIIDGRSMLVRAVTTRYVFLGFLLSRNGAVIG